MSWIISLIAATLVFGGQSSFEPTVTVAAPLEAVRTADSTQTGDETEEIDKTYPLNSDGRISIENINGSITIDTWDRNEVRLEAEKIAGTRERLNEIEVEVNSTPSYLKIETEFNRRERNWNCDKDCRMEVRYKLTVPRGAALNEIETVNGSVMISNTTNMVRASAVNGNVTAMNLAGAAQIDTVNGRTEVNFAKVTRGTRIELSTVNGQIQVSLPADADTTLRAGSVNGSITNDFGLAVRKSKYGGSRSMHGKLGNGDANINLEAVNGRLSISRRADGSAKPVTNLLTNETDDDVEAAMNGEFPAEAQRAMEAAMRDAEKSTAMAMREAQKVTAAAMRDAAKASARAHADTEKVRVQAMKDATRGLEIAEKALANVDMNRLMALAPSFAEYGAPTVDEKSDTFAVTGIPKVTIDAKKCSVYVRGWDRQEVKYRISRISRFGVSTVPSDVNVTRSENNINLTVAVAGVANKTAQAGENFPGVDLPGNSYRIEVFVPRKSDIRVMTDGDIRVEGVGGNIDLKGGDSAINVRDSNGSLKIDSADAIVRVIGFRGELDSSMENGTAYIEGEFSDLTGRADGGNFVFTAGKNLNADIHFNVRNLNFQSVEGVDVNGNSIRFGKGGPKMSFETTRGELLIRSSNSIGATD